MFEQQSQENILYIMLYGATAMLSLTACCYLLLRRSNAIAPEVTSPVRLRRWTAAFFASMAMSHVWYLPTFFLSSAEDILQSNAVGSALDFMTTIPFAIIVLLSMLQDRKRPLWPVPVMVAPLVVGLTVCGASRSYNILPYLYIYYMLLGIGFITYMVRAIRQYGRWLRDNYVDLEHKELWRSFVVMAAILLVFVIYALEPQGSVYKYITQVNGIILVGYLVWRVETLSDLGSQKVSGDEVTTLSGYEATSSDKPTTIQPDSLKTLQPDNLKTLKPDNLKTLQPDNLKTLQPDNLKTLQPDNLKTLHPQNLTPLLQKYCIDTQLYLQHDLTLLQLAKAIGTNRTYLSTYFVQEGITYNAYINDLRIRHFVRLYREAVATRRSFTARQLAHESGYRSYSTFSLAFKQRMGLTVTAWMNESVA